MHQFHPFATGVYVVTNTVGFGTFPSVFIIGSAEPLAYAPNGTAATL